MNNNDKLKKYLREMRASGKLEGISGTDIATASREKLEQWVGDCGTISVDEILALNTEEIEMLYPNKETKPQASPAPQASQSNQQTPPDMQAAFQAMQALFGGGAKVDTETLKAEIKAELAEEIGLKPLHVMVENRKTETKVDCGLQHYQFPELLQLVDCRIHCFLSGAAGSFKTTAAEEVAKALGLEYSAISVCSQTGAHSLLGYQDATGRYVTTEFRKRYELGGVFLLDEIDNGNANVLAVLNSALANGVCAFPDGMIQKHSDFVLIASGNTAGTGASSQYIGRNPLDGATLDRFAFIQWHYDEKLELAISKNQNWCKRVQSIRQAAHKLNSKLIVSPRATLSGEKAIAAGMTFERAEYVFIFKGMQQEERMKILSNVVY